MAQHPLSILFIHTFYPEFLGGLYDADAELARLPYELQRERLLATRFGVSDAYSHNLSRLGCDASDIIVNADPLQRQWTIEQSVSVSGNIHDQRRQILRAQVEAAKPDVVYVFEWSPLGDAFLAEIKPLTRLLVAQIASPLPESRTFAAYDLMVSSWPPIVEHFHRERSKAAYLRLAFDERVLEHIGDQPPRLDVTFVGGFAPSHTDRVAWLEQLLAALPVEVFGYGVDNTPQTSSIRSRHRGEVWGRSMYETLARSRITLNRHARIDVRGRVDIRFANNMRLYEATGVGACLVTEGRENLRELFEPGREVVAYSDPQDCIEKVRYYLAHEDEREAIALAGKERTLREHTYAQRMEELLGMLHAHLESLNAGRHNRGPT